jgi:alpha-L-arabinofuranosidase
MKLRDLILAQKNRIWSMLYLGAVGLLFLAGFSGNTKPTWAQTGPTVINIGTTALHSDVKRLGMNIGGQSFYDSGQMLRNLTFNNPGFEGQQFRSVLTCTAVSGNTCTDGNGGSQWPANFYQGATFSFFYGSAKGKTGTLVGMTAPNGSTGAWYNFGNVAPAVGDYFTLQKNMPGFQTVNFGQQAGWWPNASGGATITAETTDLSPETPGVQAVALNASGSGQSATELSYFDGEDGRSFLQMNGTYTITFRAKGNGGSNQLNVSAGRLGTANGNLSYFNKTISLTSSWADYSYSFTANEDGSVVGSGYLNFTASGSNVLLDDAAMTESASPDNPSPFRDAVVDRLRELNPGVLRYMDSGLDFGSTIDNMIAPPDARMRTGFSYSYTTSFDVPIGLEEFLQLCQAVGAEPWYTMPMGMSATEAQNLIEFLGGSASTPYGAKRAALGQSAPWTSVFPVIHLELGDESWNYAFGGDTIGNPNAYGTLIGTIFGAARASASYDASKFDLILDGQAVNPWYGMTAMNNANNTYDTVDAAPYTFYNLTSWATNEDIFGSMFAEPEAQDSRSTGDMYQQMQMVTGQTSGLTGKKPNLAVYEVNLSTVAGTAPQSIINSTVPSLGAGLSIAEHMLLMMRDDDVSLQTMFALPEYENGYTNTNGGSGVMQLWGTVIDMGGPTNLCRPQFLAEELANTAVGGTMLAAVQSGSNPTWDENSPNDPYNPINITGAHYIQSFAFANGTENSLVLFNLSRTSALPVTFTGVNAPKGTVQVGLLTSPNLTDTNESTSKVAIANSTVENFNPAATTNLPPYSMTVYRWSTSGGVTTPQPTSTTTSLTASPTSITVGQTVALTATVAAASGTASGSVVFSDGGTTLGTGTLSGGVATLNVTTLSVGTHTITAAFQGDSAFGSSTSAAVVVTVSSATVPLIATKTTLTAPASVTDGQSMVLTAAVAATSGATPTGTVTFKAGNSIFGTASLAGGKATFTVPSVNLAAGDYQLTAVYGGNTVDASSTSSASTLKVSGDLISTTTTVSLASLKLTEGKSYTATASVKAASGATPTGTVDFTVGTTVIGTSQLSGGVAKFTINADLAPGTYNGTASYMGTSTDAPSTSAAITFTVVANTVATVTSLTSNTTQTAEGSPVVLTAAVLPQTPGVTATGAVTFYLGQTALGTGQLAGGQAVLSIATQFAPGSYQLSAVYAGNGTDDGSTSNLVTLTITADAVATSVQLTVSPTQLTSGQSTVLAAKVAAAGGGSAPTGAVNFYLGQTKIGSATLSNGIADYNYVASMAPGTYQVTATYAGTSQDNASSSAPVTITIVPSVVATTTSLTSSASQVTQGQSFTLAAVVAPTSGSATPQGTVSFYLGQTQVGTVALSSGNATFTDSSSIAPGTYQLTAVYTGNSQDSASTSSPVTLIVAAAILPPQPLPTTTGLSIDPQVPTTGQTMVLQVKVAATGSTSPIAGTVTLYMGQTAIGTATVTAGSGNLSMQAPQPGTYTASAVFAAQGSYAASQSMPVTFKVEAGTAITTPPPPPPAGSFTIGLSSDSVTMGKAQIASLQVLIAAVQGYKGSVQLSCGGLPAGVSCSFAPADLSIDASQAASTLSFSAQTNAARNSAIISNVSLGVLLPWDIIGVLGFISGRKRLRGRWGTLMTLCLALVCSTIWMTGCGLTVNSVSQPYQVTVTAVGQNQTTQSTTLTLYVTQAAATF